MWLGNKRMSNDNPLPIIWTNKVKVLGIVFSYDEKLATSLNFDDKIISLKQTLAPWKSRDLTVIGKIVIVKTFGLSKFLYVSSMISTPLTIQRQINSIIHQFIDCFYKKLYNAGIIYVNDLLNREGKFDVYGTLGDGFNNMDYLKLIGIIHSIPNSWKRQITSKIVLETANKINCITGGPVKLDSMWTPTNATVTCTAYVLPYNFETKSI